MNDIYKWTKIVKEYVDLKESVEPLDEREEADLARKKANLRLRDLADKVSSLWIQDEFSDEPHRKQWNQHQLAMLGLLDRHMDAIDEILDYANSGKLPLGGESSE